MVVENVMLWLRVLPMLCGLAMVEVAFRCSRILFPGRDDLQIAGTVVGALFPMNLYMFQVVSNEPLSGFLTAALICYCFKLLATGGQGSIIKQCILLGVLFGLALLSKATAILLLPLLILLIAYLAWSRGLKLWPSGLAIGCFLSTTSALAGWYYIRNWVQLGRPFVLRGWDDARGGSWWQDPGYRTPDDLLSFGESVVRPVYSSFAGFWDGLYSTLWSDAYLSSAAFRSGAPPWNYELMISMALLSVPMTLLIVTGVLVTVRGLLTRHIHAASVFSSSCLGVYLAALLYVFLTVPQFSAVKSSYALGLMPCFVALIGLGLSVVPQNPASRAIVGGYLCCWAVSGYLSYFVW